MMGEKLTDEEREILVKGINVYVKNTYLDINYTNELNVNNAYDYLKTLPEFEGSKDI